MSATAPGLSLDRQWMEGQMLSLDSQQQLHLTDIERVYAATSLVADYPPIRWLTVPCCDTPQQEEEHSKNKIDYRSESGYELNKVVLNKRKAEELTERLASHVALVRLLLQYGQRSCTINTRVTFVIAGNKMLLQFCLECPL